MLLGPNDSPAFKVVNPDGGAEMLLVCDHASAAVPKSLNRLGLAEDVFEGHIAYDIGAAGVARRMSAVLDAQLVLAGYSRLTIDLNRPLGHPDSIIEESDGTAIPGNVGLTETDRCDRIYSLFEPYHDAINRALMQIGKRGRAPALLSVHSFSPSFGSTPRPWDIGVLWNRDPRIAVPMMEKLKARGLHVGDNEPYSGRHLAYSIDKHGADARIANCVVEINQNQVCDETGITRWSEILSQVMGEILPIEGVHRFERF